MLYIDPVLTAFALLPLPLMSAGIYFISASIHKKSDAKQQAQSAVSSFVQQHIAGMRVLKSFTVNALRQNALTWKRTATKCGCSTW